MINFSDIHKLQRLVLLEYGCDFLMIFQFIVYEVLESFNFQMCLLRLRFSWFCYGRSECG